MADDVRQALEEYAATTLYGHSDHKLEKYAPRAFDALRKVLDVHFSDDPCSNRWCRADGWPWPCPTAEAILSALTDSPDMAMEDR